MNCAFRIRESGGRDGGREGYQGYLKTSIVTECISYSLIYFRCSFCALRWEIPSEKTFANCIANINDSDYFVVNFYTRSWLMNISHLSNLFVFLPFLVIVLTTNIYIIFSNRTIKQITNKTEDCGYTSNLTTPAEQINGTLHQVIIYRCSFMQAKNSSKHLFLHRNVKITLWDRTIISNNN